MAATVIVLLLQQHTLMHMGGGVALTPAQLLDQQQKANTTMIEMEERRIEKMKRRQVRSAHQSPCKKHSAVLFYCAFRPSDELMEK